MLNFKLPELMMQNEIFQYRKIIRPHKLYTTINYFWHNFNDGLRKGTCSASHQNILHVITNPFLNFRQTKLETEVLYECEHLLSFWLVSFFSNLHWCSCRQLRKISFVLFPTTLIMLFMAGLIRFNWPYISIGPFVPPRNPHLWSVSVFETQT